MTDSIHSKGKKVTGILFIAVTVWYSFFIIQPPSPVPADAADSTFSAERAFRHVQAIARHPHPVGSAEHDTVKQYLVQAFRDIGLTPQVQEGTTGAYRSYGFAADIKNIFVKIPGSDPENTILLMAHYDSVPNGKGGGDDGSGIAAILETIRAITAGPPLKNNVWILLTDGEEIALLGAEMFMEEYPFSEEIDLVMNVEARGTSGASVMFETNSGNSAIIPHFARATSNPVANSLTYTIYKLLPNDTDMSVTKRAGIQGLNFALIEDYLNYHTMQDAPKQLSMASLQHHGENLLSNLRHFGNRAFDLQAENELVYFNNPSGGLTYYPSSWSLPLALLTLLLFAGFLIYLFRTSRLSTGSFLLSMILHLAILVGSILLTHFGWRFIRILHPEYRWLVQGETYNHIWYLWGFISLTLCLITAVYAWLGNKWPLDTIMVGIYTVWVSASLVVAWYLPTAAYVVSIPVLFGLTGWIIYSGQIHQIEWKTLLIVLASLFPAVFIIPPYIRLVQVTLTTAMLPASMVLLAFLAALGWPLIQYIIREKIIYVFTGLLVIFLVCIGGAAINSGFDENHRKQNSMIYARNFDSETSYWLSLDPAADEWTRQFLGSQPDHGKATPFRMLHGNYLKAPAATMDIPSPDLSILSKEVKNSLIYLTLNVELPVGGQLVQVEYPNIKHLVIDGKNVFNGMRTNNKVVNAQNRVVYFGSIPETLHIELTAEYNPEESSIVLEWIDYSLPVHLVESYTPRAPHMMPGPNRINDASVFRKSFVLGN